MAIATTTPTSNVAGTRGNGVVIASSRFSDISYQFRGILSWVESSHTSRRVRNYSDIN